MMKTLKTSIYLRLLSGLLISTGLLATSCDSLFSNDDDDNGSSTAEVIFLVIDEDSIDNGNEPNNFSEEDVNDQLATIGLRQPLKYFQDNVGKTIELYTGEVGDEGWFALKTIPSSWKSTGPTANGLDNYLTPGPKLGAAVPDDDREVLLDKIPDVTPLRATGLKMLEGKTVLAIVYDSDISINYSPLNGNLQGANLGRVAFDVLSIRKRTDGSDSSLPAVSIRIRNVNEVAGLPLGLFSNAPVPSSSSTPFDVTPPASAPAAVIIKSE
ncbi:MAG: hypothetical protein MUE95_03680 [Cyclobacteriaceae bacterium]|jgi:hypothetical protein|nr:hypothetical protein [Cyclobacteriaceae bacterium]